MPGLDPAPGPEVPSLLAPSPEIEPHEDEDESDLLDIRVQMDESFSAAMGALGRIAATGQRQTQLHLQRKVEAEDLIRLGGRDPKRVQSWANLYAQDFGSYARELRSLTAEFRSASDDFFVAMGKWIALRVRLDASSRPEISKGLEVLARGNEGARAARDVYAKIADSISGLRPLTREFKRQQRIARQQVDEVNAAIASWIDRTDRLRESLDGSGDGAA